MIVVDEYLASRVVSGDWPLGLPDDQDVALTAGPALAFAATNPQARRRARLMVQPGCTAYPPPVLGYAGTGLSKPRMSTFAACWSRNH
jgi:hypothetical protein